MPLPSHTRFTVLPYTAVLPYTTVLPYGNVLPHGGVSCAELKCSSVAANLTFRYTKFDCTPSRPISDVAKGTYYLTEIDSLERRHYARALHTTAAPLVAATTATAAPAPRPVGQFARALPRFTTLMAPAVRIIRRVFH
jgi:hypothetical protein